MSHTHFTKWGGCNPSSLHWRSFGFGCIRLKTRVRSMTLSIAALSKFSLAHASLLFIQKCLCPPHIFWVLCISCSSWNSRSPFPLWPALLPYLSFQWDILESKSIQFLALIFCFAIWILGKVFFTQLFSLTTFRSCLLGAHHIFYLFLPTSSCFFHNFAWTFQEEGYTFYMKMSNLAHMKTCTSSGQYWWNHIQLLCHRKNEGLCTKRNLE